MDIFQFDRPWCRLAIVWWSVQLLPCLSSVPPLLGSFKQKRCTVAQDVLPAGAGLEALLVRGVLTAAATAAAVAAAAAASCLRFFFPSFRICSNNDGVSLSFSSPCLRTGIFPLEPASTPSWDTTPIGSKPLNCDTNPCAPTTPGCCPLFRVPRFEALFFSPVEDFFPEAFREPGETPDSPRFPLRRRLSETGVFSGTGTAAFVPGEERLPGV